MITLFLHIPRTAGTTLNYILANHFGIANRTTKLSVFNINQFNNIQKGIRQYKSLPIDEKQAIQFISGHFQYGLHDILSSDEYKYITLLRNPINRIISHYCYVTYDHKNHLHDRVANKMTIQDFATHSGFKEVDNIYLRSISGIDCDFGKCTHDMIEKAIENIQKDFAYIGFTEYFPTVIDDLKKMNYFIPNNMASLHINQIHHQSSSVLPIEIIQQIKDFNAMDIELYNLLMNTFITSHN